MKRSLADRLGSIILIGVLFLTLFSAIVLAEESIEKESMISIRSIDNQIKYPEEVKFSVNIIIIV